MGISGLVFFFGNVAELLGQPSGYLLYRLLIALNSIDSWTKALLLAQHELWELPTHSDTNGMDGSGVLAIYLVGRLT